MNMKILSTTWSIVIMMTMTVLSCKAGKDNTEAAPGASSDTPSIVEKPIATTGTFDRLDISGIDEVTVAHGDSSQVSFSGDEEAIAQFSVDTKDGLLVIKKEGKSRHQQQVKVHISLPSLHGMKIAGTGSVILQDETKTDILKADINGCGSLKTEGIICDELKMNVSGVSDVRLNGITAQDASLSMNGDGSVEASFTDTGSLSCSFQGVGSVSLKGNVKSFQKEANGVGQLDTSRSEGK